MSVNPTPFRIALIGFGEAGGIIGHDLAVQGVEVRTYDRLLDDAARRQPLLDKAEASGVRACANAAEAASGAHWIISAVTAGSALDVAERLAPSLKPGQVFIDINSVAPDTKRRACTAVERSGAHYIDAAVMAPVPPKRLRTPILLGGTQACALAPQLGELGFNVQVISEEIGVTSAIKMCRSVMIKGLEALTRECLFTARHYGAEQEVLASLHNSFPSMGWNAELPGYLISRIAEHGLRRAEEMEEVAKTAADAGVTPNMAQATVLAQRGLVGEMFERGLAYAEPFAWQDVADQLVGR